MSALKTLIFAGCSFTAGTGWHIDDPTADGKNSEKLWVNLCYKNINWPSPCQLLNVGQGGASNSEIFENTVQAMSRSDIDVSTVFCQWTAGPRYNFTVGFELWDTQQSFVKDHKNTNDINLHDGLRYSKEYIKDLIDRLRSLHHPHWEILSVVRFSAILSALAEKIGCQIFFINGLCIWDRNYFVELHNVDPESYTPFTKKSILDIDARSDEDICKLYHLAHRHYNEMGGIDESQWINLYDSFLINRTDRNFDGRHPGEKSNWFYYQMIKKRLEELGYLR